MVDYKKKYLKYKYKYKKLIGGEINMNDIIDRSSKNVDTERFILTKENDSYIKLIDREYDIDYLFEIGQIIYIYDKLRNILFFINEEGDIDLNHERYLDILEQYRSETSLPRLILSLKNVRNIKFRKLSELSNCASLNIDEINIKLDELNLLLQKKEPHLSLKLNKTYLLPGNITSYFQEPNMVLLCLYYNDDCVSSIGLQFKKNNIIEISSRTLKSMEGRKYNKLLRSIILIISTIILCNQQKIEYIYSAAENPISVWLLISNFNCIVTDEIKGFVKVETSSEDNPYTQKELSDDFKEGFMEEIEILVPINEELARGRENIEKAYTLFEKLVSGE